MTDSYNPETDGAQMSFDKDMSYGGTSAQYLRKMLEVELFPELWNVRGAL